MSFIEQLRMGSIGMGCHSCAYININNTSLIRNIVSINDTNVYPITHIKNTKGFLFLVPHVMNLEIVPLF